MFLIVVVKAPSIVSFKNEKKQLVYFKWVRFFGYQ